MTRLQLSSQTRTNLSKSETKRIRREGGVPATVYGRSDKPQAIAVSQDDLMGILRTPGGRLSLIDLKVNGKGSKAHPVIIQEIQRDPISKRVVHVDFHRVSMNEPVHASVPIILVGEAPGTKIGGILEQVTRELEIKSLPDHIPTHIDVDVSHLELGQSIHVSEVGIPADAEVIGPVPENVVASVRPPTVRVQEAAPEAAEAPAEEETAAEE